MIKYDVLCGDERIGIVYANTEAQALHRATGHRAERDPFTKQSAHFAFDDTGNAIQCIPIPWVENQRRKGGKE